MSSSQKPFLWPVCRFCLARWPPFLLHPPRFPRLGPYCPCSWHRTAGTPPRLALYCSSAAGTLLLVLYPPLWLVDLSSDTPSRGKALASWLLSDALDRCNDLRHWASGRSGLTASVFSPVDDHLSSAHWPAFRLSEQALSFVLGSLPTGLGLSTCVFLCFVSLSV